MKDETLKRMNRKRFNNKDYLIMFLVGIIVLLFHIAEIQTIRVIDHRAFIDGLAESNDDLKMQMTIEITETVVDAIVDDLKRDEYNLGWDDGYAEAPGINVTVLGGAE